MAWVDNLSPIYQANQHPSFSICTTSSSSDSVLLSNNRYISITSNTLLGFHHCTRKFTSSPLFVISFGSGFWHQDRFARLPQPGSLGLSLSTSTCSIRYLKHWSAAVERISTKATWDLEAINHSNEQGEGVRAKVGMPINNSRGLGQIGSAADRIAQEVRRAIHIVSTVIVRENSPSWTHQCSVLSTQARAHACDATHEADATFPRGCVPVVEGKVSP